MTLVCVRVDALGVDWELEIDLLDHVGCDVTMTGSRVTN